MYTVYSTNNPDDVSTGLTAEQAMEAILTEDGYTYDIREAEDGLGWILFTSDGSANSTRSSRHLTASVIWSSESRREDAIGEIALKVIAASVNCYAWGKHVEAMTDESYARMQADLAAEEGEAA